MPVALLIAGRGDARDAVGLFLAGRGWTALPAPADADGAVAALRAAEPGLVAVDLREDGAAGLASLRALRSATTVPVLALNVPPELAAEVAALPGVDVATEPTDVPRAPGVPAPPHEAPPA